MANLSIIRELCKRKKIPLKELAELLDISEHGLQRILRSNSTKIDTLERIAEILKVPINIFFQEDKNFPDSNLSDFLDSPVLKFISNQLESFYAKINFYKDYYVWKILKDIKLNCLPKLPYIPRKPRTIITQDEIPEILKLPNYCFIKSYSKWNEKEINYFQSEFYIIDAFYVTIFEKNFMNISDLLEDGIIKDKEFITYWNKWKNWAK